MYTIFDFHHPCVIAAVNVVIVFKWAENMKPPQLFFTTYIDALVLVICTKDVGGRTWILRPALSAGDWRLHEPATFFKRLIAKSDKSFQGKCPLPHTRVYMIIIFILSSIIMIIHVYTISTLSIRCSDISLSRSWGIMASDTKVRCCGCCSPPEMVVESDRGQFFCARAAKPFFSQWLNLKLLGNLCSTYMIRII